MKNLKKLTILHSNDMHGDFLAEQIDENLVGGVSFLSGYVNQVRKQEKNVIYAIAGDMFRGSVIDSEYKGVSTIGIMNLLEVENVNQEKWNAYIAKNSNCTTWFEFGKLAMIEWMKAKLEEVKNAAN